MSLSSFIPAQKIKPRLELQEDLWLNFEKLHKWKMIPTFILASQTAFKWAILSWISLGILHSPLSSVLCPSVRFNQGCSAETQESLRAWPWGESWLRDRQQRRCFQPSHFWAYFQSTGHLPLFPRVLKILKTTPKKYLSHSGPFPFFLCFLLLLG